MLSPTRIAYKLNKDTFLSLLNYVRVIYNLLFLFIINRFIFIFRCYVLIPLHYTVGHNTPIHMVEVRIGGPESVSDAHVSILTRDTSWNDDERHHVAGE